MKPADLAKLAVLLGAGTVAVCTGSATAGTTAIAALSGLGKDVLKDWSKDLVTKAPLPRTVRERLNPLGKPNHHLHKALESAIIEALRDFDLEKHLLKKTDTDQDVEGRYPDLVKAYCRQLRDDPEIFLNIESDNTSLKDFLERPTPETFEPFTAFLQADMLVGVPKKVRSHIVAELHTLIAARFWDQVKNNPPVWNAYNAEVFKEFRRDFLSIKGSLSNIDQKQKEILAQLEIRELRLTIPKGQKFDYLPEEIRQAHARLLTSLTEQLAQIRQKLEDLHRDIGVILTTQKQHDEILERIENHVKILVANIPVSTEKIELTLPRNENSLPIPAARIHASLLEATRNAQIDEETEAEKQSHYQAQEQLKQASKTAHQRRLINIDSLAKSLAELGSSADATDVSKKMTQILAEKTRGADQALVYLATQRKEVLGEARRVRELLQHTLQPILHGAQIAENRGKLIQAESYYRDILQVNPDWHHARYLYVEFLLYIKGPRSENYEKL